jgi:aldehyde:ferredoxin oxidoreductase
MKGCYGKYLKVDLTSRQSEEIPISEQDQRDFVGGSTLAARLLFEKLHPGFDPFSPENPLIFSSGPFTGSNVPMVSRSAVSGISPATGLWGEATTGGKFPVRLKATGFDAIMITGFSETPVYVSINNDNVSIKDASHLWGKDIYEAQSILKKEHEGRISVACIGVAGEKRIAFATIMNDEGRAAGRCGMGALMGSKNLKALVVSGDSKAPVASPERLKKSIEEARDCIGSHPNTSAYRLYGTNFYLDLAMRLGDAPARYFTKSVFPAARLHGPTFRTRYSMTHTACTGCPVGCGRVIKNFSDDIGRVDGPEYETVAAFGPLCMNFDIDSVVRANHICNLHGMDTISAGVAIAFAMYLYEKGVITQEDAGMEILWGDGGTVLKLVELMIQQEGIGRLLSRGVKKMAEELGVDPGEAAHVKGLEIPMHDPRAYQGAALAYAVGPRGACHLKGSFYSLDAPGTEIATELGITFSDKNDPLQKGAATAKALWFCELYNSFTLCQFSPFTASMIAEMFYAITNVSIKPMDLLTFGERSLNLKRAINNILGVTRKDDALPEIASRPLQEGATAGIEPAMDLMLKDFYNVCEWDWETGMLSKSKLHETGLGWVADRLHGKMA